MKTKKEFLTEWGLQVDLWKIKYFNRGDRCEDMSDHRSYTHNLSSCEFQVKPEKNLGFSNGIRTHDFCVLPTGLSSQLGTGHDVSS